jgi:predicted phosphodiesterase
VRYGFFSDAHGDMKAVENSLSALGDVDEIFFLGDIIGGNDSENCIDCIRSRAIKAVIGNHDTWMCETKTLSPESLSFLESLPVFIEREDFLALHSEYEEVNGEIFFHNVQSSHECLNAFSRHSHHLIFMGHTHRASVNRLQDGVISYIPLKETSVIRLDSNSRYLINTGIASISVMVYDSVEEKLYVRFHDSGRP